MSDGYIGEIRAFPYNFAPMDWLTCNGQTVAINDFSELFALIGTTYGGDGSSNFALPDLRGRVSICQGNGTRLTPRTLGAHGGDENVVINSAQVPAHSHSVIPANVLASLMASAAPADIAPPAGNSLSANKEGDNVPRYSSSTPGTVMNAKSIVFSGTTDTSGGPATAQSHANIMPVLGVQYCICYQGVWPQQS